MSHQLRAQTSIASERRDAWRRETEADRRFETAEPRPIGATGPGFRLAVIGRLSIADIRRRIAGAFAEA